MSLATPHALVGLEACQVTLGGAVVLSDVTWVLRPGEHWLFTGPNGSGKTSLLALIRGDLWPAPSKGQRWYDLGAGRSSSPIRAREQFVRLGPEFQDLYRTRGWNLNAEEVIRTGVHQTMLPYALLERNEEERVKDLIARMGVESLAPRRFLDLSLGEQRKVLIARAMAGQPRVLILDEFLVGLDRATRESVLRMLEQAAASGVQTLTASHRAGDILPWTTHHGVMKQGCLVSQGPWTGRHPTLETTETRERRPCGAGQVLVAFDQVEARIKGRSVLRDVCWGLNAGEHWQVLGGNGAGKTTLLRLVRGDLPPYRGAGITRPVLGPHPDAWTRRQVIGFVSPEHQGDMLDGDRTVRELLEDSLALARRSVLFEAGGRGMGLHEILEELALWPAEDRPFQALSHGQKQLAVLARALVRQPAILLLDEPFNGLDGDSRQRLFRLLEGLTERGVTLVCATHEPEALPACFRRVLTVDQGHLVEAGPRNLGSGEVLLDPALPVV